MDAIDATYIGKGVVGGREIKQKGGLFAHSTYTEKEVVATGESVKIIAFSIHGLPNSPVAIFPDKEGILRSAEIENFRIKEKGE
ncbi:hypothetical protein LCGC14_2463280 [marine sediment metagenome]|uniref:Uncharacterized protein n=1 Tax=marine sediment metagenome TaxID=412755 RepID=A0A0F9DPP7_9ZZZZ